MRALVEQVRSGQWRGYSDKAITDVVSIGIGGSNLGPLIATEALKSYGDGRIKVHYVSNVDGAQIADVLSQVYAETNLIVVSYNSFTHPDNTLNYLYDRSTILYYVRSG